MPRQSLAFLIGLVAVAFFSGSLPATRLAVMGLDPWFVAVARAAVAGVVAAALLAIWRPAFPRAHTARLIVISLCLVIGFPATMALASVAVPASHGGVILGLLPIATTIGAVLFAGERPSAWFWLLSVIGAALVVAFAVRQGDFDVVSGDLLLIAGILIAGSGYALAAELTLTVPGWQVISWAVIVSLPLVVPATIILWPAGAGSAPLSAWAGLVYGGVGSQFAGYALWNVALAWGGVAKIGQLQLLQPFVTFLIAVPLLGETVDGPMIALAAAVAVVVALGRRATVTRRTRQTDADSGLGDNQVVEAEDGDTVGR